MAFDEDLAERVRDALKNQHIHFDEKRMFGGVCFMVDRKMCVGVSKDRLLVRLDPSVYETSLQKPGCIPMEFTGKPMRGFVFVKAEGTSTRKSLQFWIDLALEFNPHAKLSAAKPRKKSAQSKSAKAATRRKTPNERP